MIRYAVPVASSEGLSSVVNDHFGMSEYFAVLDVQNQEIVSVKVIHNTVKSENSKNTAEFIVDQGVEVVLAGRIGSCMIRIFQDRGIKMFSGAEGTVKDAFEDYKAGKLREVQPNPYLL